MQKELDQEATSFSIQILGINAIGAEEFNDTFTLGRSLPLLQDTASENVWSRWGITYRDVVILSTTGEEYDVYNLTNHDLANINNYEALKERILEAP